MNGQTTDPVAQHTNLASTLSPVKTLLAAEMSQKASSALSTQLFTWAASHAT